MLSDGALEGDRQNDGGQPQSQMDADLVCSDGLRIAVALLTAAKSAAQRAAEAAQQQRANAGRNGEAHGANAIALKRRELRVKIVNLEPQGKRRVPPIEISRSCASTGLQEASVFDARVYTTGLTPM